MRRSTGSWASERRAASSGHRVGVVGVVQHQRPRRRPVELHPPLGERRLAQPLHHLGEGDAAGQGRGRGRHRVGGLVLAPHGQPEGARPPWRLQVEARPEEGVDAHHVAPHLPAPHPEGDDRGLRPVGHGRHQGDAGVEHRRPGGGQALDQLGLGRRHVLHRPEQLGVGHPHGGDHAHRRAGRRRTATAMWPRPRAPISTTTASVPAGALTRVRGTPSSLLNDFRLAAVTSRRANTDASMSLVDVLPTDPVMPTTRSGSRSRAARPRAVRAAPVSATTMAVVPSTGVRDVR